jgi:outer membrane protein TolC
VAVPFTTRQRLRSAVAGMATLSALSSCVVGPNYEAPRISLTAFHSTAPDNQETSGVRPKLDSWWTDFHDSLLTQTIQEALAQNLDLAASLDRVEQARAAAREAGAQLYPTGQLTAQAAGADAQAAEADQAAVRISIAAAVADSYLQVRGYQSRLQLAKDQVATRHMDAKEKFQQIRYKEIASTILLTAE